MKYPKIPTHEQCLQMMSEMQMMDHIVAHSLQVCRVALFLAEELNRNNHDLNCELIRAAALLHDITKTRSFDTGENHALTGGRFMAQQGYPEIGELIRQHVKLDEYPADGMLSETAIINYADKRVLHDKIVGLNKRLEYILQRYARNAGHRQRIFRLWEKTKTLEDRIFSHLEFSAAELEGLIRAGDDKCAQ
jgi:putative nucleotidyltransferase with HDIG domain